MKSNLSLILINATIASMLVACGSKDASTKLKDLQAQKVQIEAEIKALEKEVAKSGSADKAISLKVVQVGAESLIEKPFYHYIDIQGKVTSDKNVSIGAKTPSTIVKIYVQKGQRVKAGQVLAKLDDAILRKGLDEANNGLDLVIDLFNKQKALWEQKIGTEVQFLQAKNQKESLEKKIEGLKEQLNLYVIKAPFEGIVNNIVPKEGEIASPGFPFFTISNNSEFKATAEIAEAYISKVKVGNPATLTFPDINETKATNLTVIGDIINPINRTFGVDVKLGASNKYKANMITYFKILDYTNPKSIVIPINIIQNSTEGSYVYVAQDNKAVKRIIKVGQTYGNDAQIVGGLSAGEQVITVGFQELTDGQSIKF